MLTDTGGSALAVLAKAFMKLTEWCSSKNRPQSDPNEPIHLDPKVILCFQNRNGEPTIYIYDLNLWYINFYDANKPYQWQWLYFWWESDFLFKVLMSLYFIWFYYNICLLSYKCIHIITTRSDSIEARGSLVSCICSVAHKIFKAHSYCHLQVWINATYLPHLSQAMFIWKGHWWTLNTMTLFIVTFLSW